jgi:hypothetical protein
LLDRLKKLVTTNLKPEVMIVVTGIPPNIGTAHQLANTLDVMTDLVQKIGEHGNNLMEAVEEALGTKAWESGHVTGSEPIERDIGEFPKGQCQSRGESARGDTDRV